MQLTAQFVLSAAAVLFLGPASMAASAATIETRNTGTPPAPEKLRCGSQWYIKGDYTCYDNCKLCPIKKEVDPPMASYPCGNDCYFPNEYVCYGTRMCPTPLAPYICVGPDNTWSCFHKSMYQCKNGRLEPAD